MAATTLKSTWHAIAVAYAGELGGFTYLHREYVWGPGDRGIDELLAVFTGTHPGDGLAARTPWYAITDTGGEVVSLESPPPRAAPSFAICNPCTPTRKREP